MFTDISLWCLSGVAGLIRYMRLNKEKFQNVYGKLFYLNDSRVGTAHKLSDYRDTV